MKSHHEEEMRLLNGSLYGVLTIVFCFLVLLIFIIREFIRIYKRMLVSNEILNKIDDNDILEHI